MEAIKNKIEAMSTDAIKSIMPQTMQIEGPDAGLVVSVMLDVLCDRIGIDATDAFIDSI